MRLQSWDCSSSPTHTPWGVVLHTPLARCFPMALSRAERARGPVASFAQLRVPSHAPREGLPARGCPRGSATRPVGPFFAPPLPSVERKRHLTKRGFLKTKYLKTESCRITKTDSVCKTGRRRDAAPGCPIGRRWSTAWLRAGVPEEVCPRGKAALELPAPEGPEPTELIALSLM